MPRRALALAALLASSAAACASRPAPPSACTTSADCAAAGLVCDPVTETCVQCLDDSECLLEGHHCIDHRCVEPRPCISSVECPGLVCDDALGYCVECVTDLDCEDGFVCRGSTCEVAGGPCRSDRDCSALGLVCDPASGICVACVRDADCTGGRVCRASACVPPGLDAGPGSDGGGTTDGGGMLDAPIATDAPRDAPLRDAPLPPPDARRTDAPGASSPLDVLVLLDVTGSLSSFVLSTPAIDALVDSLVRPLVTRPGADVRVGLAIFADVPNDPYGASTDTVFAVRTVPTRDVAAFRTAALGTSGQNGTDFEEGGVAALYEVAGSSWGFPNTVRPTCAAGSELGGCFRTGAPRAVVVVSDAVFHGAPTSSVPYTTVAAPTWAETRARLTGAGIEVFAIATSGVTSMWTMMEADLGVSTLSARVDVSVPALNATGTPWTSLYAATHDRIVAEFGL